MNSLSQHQTKRATWRRALALRTDESGAIGVEYGLLAAMVALVILGTLSTLGENLAGLPLQGIVDALTGAIS